MTEHLFIVNPAAGKTDRTTFVEKAAKAAKEEWKIDSKITVYRTSCAGDATRFLEEKLKKTAHPVRVYSCGGDGTLNECVKGVYSSGRKDVALGVVPTGSGNDYIRSFGIPESAFRSVRDMMQGEVHLVDLVRVTGEKGPEYVCVNVASAGFDAAVCRRMDSFRRVPLLGGSMAYKMALGRQFVSHLGHRFDVYADGKQVKTPGKDEYLFALVANGKYYGGGFHCSPKSTLTDGKLNLILIESIPRTQFIGLLGPYRKGEYFEKMGKRMVHKTVKTVEFRSPKPMDVNVDGEILSMKNPRFDILPAALPLILPIC